MIKVGSNLPVVLPVRPVGPDAAARLDSSITVATAAERQAARGSALDRRRAIPRPSAFFVAHLIAVAQQTPQVRLRRRAEPMEAAACYGAATAAPTRPGRIQCIA